MWLDALSRANSASFSRVFAKARATFIACIMLAVAGPARAEDEDSYVARARQIMPQCAFATVPASERLVILGLANGVFVSDLIVAGIKHPAQLALISVEPGPEKIAIAIFGDNNMLYEIDDPHDRVARVVFLSTPDQGNGVVTDRRERVALVDPAKCFGFADALRVAPEASPKMQAMQRVSMKAYFDHKPDHIVFITNAEKLFIPSGEREVAKDPMPGVTIDTDVADGMTIRQRYDFRPDGKAIQHPIERFSKAEMNEELEDLLSGSPSGLRRVDPAKVVSHAKVERNPIVPVKRP